MEKRVWPDMEEKEEDDALTFGEDEIVAPSELRLEQMLCSKLTLDAVDMGNLPNADYSVWASGQLHKTASEHSLLEERKPSNLSLKTLNRENTPSPQNRVPRIQSLQRLRTSVSMDRLDEADASLSPHLTLSPRGSLPRRSSNLSQVLTTLKKSPSMDFVKTVSRDEHAMSPPPPPPNSDAALHSLGPRRQSNLAVMRLIAESM